MTPSDPRLQLEPPGSTPRMILFATCVLLPVCTTAAALAWSTANDQANKLIAGNLALTLALTLAGIGVLVTGIWYVLDRAMRRQALDLSPSTLEVKTSFYTSRTPLAGMQLGQARVIDLEEHTDLAPRIKTNGYALPGFKSGHFRLKNGNKAFVAIAGQRHVLWLPTNTGKGLLLQPRQPDLLLQKLRELAGNTAGR